MHFPKGQATLQPVGEVSRIQCTFQSITGAPTMVFSHGKCLNISRKFSPHLEGDESWKIKKKLYL